MSSDPNTSPLFLNRVLVDSADHHLFFGRHSATPSDGRSQPLSGPVHPQVRRLLDGEQPWDLEERPNAVHSRSKTDLRRYRERLLNELNPV